MYAYVIMPSHIHAILQAPTLADITTDFKAHTARAILKQIEANPSESRKEWLMHMFKYYAKYEAQNKDYQFWQKTNHPTELTNPEMFQQKVDYIHSYPVVAGLVTDAEYWRYSSACIDGYLKVDEA